MYRWKHTIALSGLSCLLFACSAYRGPEPQILPDYRSDLSNPVRDAEQAWAGGERRFAAVATGRGLLLPPLTQDRYNRCYATAIGIRVIDRSADVIGPGSVPPRGEVLHYVAQYNEAVLRHLDDGGECAGLLER
jgi:hypothetical protein